MKCLPLPPSPSILSHQLNPPFSFCNFVKNSNHMVSDSVDFRDAIAWVSLGCAQCLALWKAVLIRNVCPPQIPGFCHSCVCHRQGSSFMLISISECINTAWGMLPVPQLLNHKYNTEWWILCRSHLGSVGRKKLLMFFEKVESLRFFFNVAE